MKVITFNVNGIRSALNKGLREWLIRENPDILCLQEIKLAETELVEPVFTDLGFHCYWYPAVKRGYSGVAILSKITVNQIVKGSGHELSDAEGRVILARYDRFQLVSAYFPSGTMGDVRQEVKYRFLDDFYTYAASLKEEGLPLLICGDVNICHTEIDIHNPRSNANTSGFLPAERAWMGKFIDTGFVDTFRYKVKDPHHYTWWSYRAGARGKNLGWRIDYIFAANMEPDALQNVQIHADVVMSDHCPVSLDLNL
ncbi:MAG: exodeoxyribonuclease III [Leadbetterella sp.]|nr:exodeoxyribonuclease III [Leadbetterella sp.]